MIFEVEAEALKKALSFVQTLIPEHDVLITADVQGQRIIIEAGNGGFYLQQIIPSRVSEEGSVAFNSPFITGLYLKGKTTFQQAADNKLYFSSEKLNGSIEVNQEANRIISIRPDSDIDTQTHVPKSMLINAINRVNFPSSMQEGLRIKLDSNITTSATDQFRAALYKDPLGQAAANFDVLVKPAFVIKVLSKIEEAEVWFGIKDATIKIASPSFLCFCPSIQIEPQDIEAWLKELPQDECLGTIKTNVETILESVKGVSSISTTSGPTSYETKLICNIAANIFEINVVTAHGSAKSSITLDESNIENLTLHLSSKYTLEILELIKSGPVTIQFWEDYILVKSIGDKCISVIPTIN